LVTEAHAREQLAQGCHLEADQPRFEPATFWIVSVNATHTLQNHDNKTARMKLARIRMLTTIAYHRYA